MSVPPPPLPDRPTEQDPGWGTAVVARIMIVLSILLGQLWALTVALEEYLAGHTDPVWWLAGFSVVSFALVALLVWLEPPPRGRRRRSSPR